MYDEKLSRRLKKELWGRDQHFYAVVLLQMALAVCSMIKTFLQEVVCQIRLQNDSNTIKVNKKYRQKKD